MYSFISFDCVALHWLITGLAMSPSILLESAPLVRIIPTEVQGISFVGNTEGEGSKPRWWNLQNLCPVPP